LKYLKENDLNITWLTFTDPDDFLDRNYFYEVDDKIKNNNNLSMISSNMIFYVEKFYLFKDTHALKDKFKNNITLLKNKNLNNFIQLSAASSFIQFNLIKDLHFDENLKPNFEDAKFINEYLLQNIEKNSIFLKNARYFYRKRKNQSSSLDNSINKAYFLNTINLGSLELLQKYNTYSFIQKVCLYHIFWQIKTLLFNPEKLAILSKDEKKEFKELLFKNFTLITSENITSFNIDAYDFFYKKGILNYFKNEDLSENIAFIESIDDKNDEILLKYYFSNINHTNKILLDEKEAIIKHSKIRQYDLLDKVFLYEKRIWLKINKNSKILDVFVNSQKLQLFFDNVYINDLTLVLKTLNKLKKQRAKNANLWIFADMSSRADDNAEHLYRYVMNNHPKQKIVFALRKDSCDYSRLKKEGFNLVDPRTLYFKYLLFKSSKVISSHIDNYIYNAFGKDTLQSKDFIFLQHGITKDNMASWFNLRKINLLITSTKAEYNSIAGDFNHYKFSTKEVVLTGLARWDALVKNNVLNTKQILIMPTWREYLCGTYSKKTMKRRLNKDFNKSTYFKAWQELLLSKELEKIIKEYNFKLYFILHPQIMPYLKYFEIPNYIQTSYKTSLQELFCTSSLMITDYSSVAFEMALLNKIVLYYQFDKKEFFEKHWQKGYFDYEKDGFGDVCYDLNSLLFTLKNNIINNNKNKNTEFYNKNCCENIYKKIINYV
ncbi:CDP-glycerol glycerophosphotransferase family protein, partial [Campylobacter canadensis]|uniref:CDP-glycerol glycerophosphotransferase family protein n=1 Tax=Campylobacter canadensis TaxID=449520 RepID=UPI001CCB4BFC